MIAVQKDGSGVLTRTDLSLVGLGAVMHFLVDGLCICCMYLPAFPLDTSDVFSLFILYNVLAFLTQPLTGWCMDRLKQKHWMLLGSMLLLTLAVLCTSLNFCLETGDERATRYVLIPLLLGLGNSMFHAWGGQQVATLTGNDIRSLGVFVSTGAVGLGVGFVYCSWALLYVLLLAYCVLAAVVIRNAESWIAKGEGQVGNDATETAPRKSRSRNLLYGFFLVLILMVVASRSLISTAFTSGLAMSGTMFLIVGLVAMLGKMAGGFFCKWLGLVTAAVLMVAGVVICCFWPFDTDDCLSFAGLFLVNCTMPVTLYLANVLLKGHEGLSFGLLAAMLVPGYLLAMDSSAFSSGFDFSTVTYYLSFLIPTILIELGVLWLLRERSKTVLWASVVINVFTNVLLNYLIFDYWLVGIGMFLMAEVVVIVVESLWYACFVRSLKQAFVYGALCNAISFLTGVLVELVINLLN